MSGVVEFLKARLAEDEAIATASYGYLGTTVLVNHIRLMREVQAKRVILDEFDLAQSRELPTEAWLGGSSGGIYLSLGRLEKAGFVVARWSEQPDGTRRRSYWLEGSRDLADGQQIMGRP